MFIKFDKTDIVIYAIDERRSFERAKTWITTLVAKWDEVNFVLLGNKCDKTDKREVNNIIKHM